MWGDIVSDFVQKAGVLGSRLDFPIILVNVRRAGGNAQSSSLRSTEEARVLGWLQRRNDVSFAVSRRSTTYRTILMPLKAPIADDDDDLRKCLTDEGETLSTGYFAVAHNC